MEIILISILASFGKLVVLIKLLGVNRVVKYSKVIDFVAIFIFPLLFLGTFSGAVTAVLSGVWLTFFLFILSVFFPYRAPLPAKRERTGFFRKAVLREVQHSNSTKGC